MGKRKDFSLYSNMPVQNKEHPNEWFDYVKTFGLDIDKEYVVKLSKSNADIVNRKITENGSYSAAFTEKIFKLYKFDNPNTPKTGRSAIEPILDLARMVDLENSTNVWRYKSNRGQLLRMVEYIINPKNNFWQELEEGKLELVDKLKESSQAETDGPKSLASKICKYFSLMFFNKDNYFINDNVVRHVLPYYLNYYELDTRGLSVSSINKLTYVELHTLLNNIKSKVDNNLSKNDIDHIMWYSYRYERDVQNDEQNALRREIFANIH